MDTRKFLKPQDVPTAHSLYVRFHVGEQVVITRGPIDTWISSLDNRESQVKVTHDFVAELEDLGVITRNLVGQQAD